MSLKTLREKTGAGLMACKNALAETNGDLDAAIVLLKEQGVIKAEKRGARTATEGLVGVHTSTVHDGAIAEINSETDFVARGGDFKGFVQEVLEAAVANETETLDVLLAATLSSGKTVEEKRQELVTQIGENIQVRRIHFEKTDGFITHYLHGSKIGVLLVLSEENEALGRDIAMHIAASHPAAVDERDLDPAVMATERKIFAAQAAESNKPEAIQEKMVAGKMQRFIKEHTLLGQAFVKNPDQTVAQLLKENGGIEVRSFVRFELGENQEIAAKEDFAEEVSKMLKEG